MKKNLLSIILILIIAMAGCQNSSNSKKPYLINTKITQSNQQQTPNSAKPISKTEEKITLTTIEAQHQEKLASIAAEREKIIKQIELEKTKVENSTKQKISESENQSKIILEESKEKYKAAKAKESIKLYQQYLFTAAILFVVLLLLFFFIHRKNQILKLKLHEDELRHKEYMQASKQHHERINKTLEILANDSTDKSLKKELVKLLKDQGAEQPKLLS